MSHHKPASTKSSSRFYAIFSVAVVILLAGVLLSRLPKQVICDESDPTVHLARQLTPQTLAELYQLMSDWEKNDRIPFDSAAPHTLPAIKNSPLNQAERILFIPAQQRIILKGCLDHSIQLQILRNNDTSSTMRDSIILRWGERPPEAGQQILWQRSH